MIARHIIFIYINSNKYKISIDMEKTFSLHFIFCLFVCSIRVIWIVRIAL